MLVAVEATRFVRDTRGIGRYVRALIPRLLEARPELSIALHVRDREQAARAETIVTSLETDPARVTIRTVAELRDSPADVFWYPWNYADPLPRRGPVVVTIHDVAPLALPDTRWSAVFRNMLWRRRYARAAADATIVITDSEFTASEVHRLLGVPRERIRVAHLGADDLRGHAASGDAAILSRLAVNPPFFLTVGSDDRRKNLATAVRAVGRIVESGHQVTLVQAGNRRNRGAHAADRRAAWLQPVAFIGDPELAALYRNTAGLIAPSIYEGFGLPVLEAMTLGAPVVCARAASLPEVAGDAAAWFEPHDDAALAATLTALLRDPALVSRMRDASLRRAAQFSWTDTAQRTLAAFDAARALAGDR